MRPIMITSLLTVALCAALPAVAALKSGALAPDFSAEASQAGKEFTFSLKDALKKGPVVVYFYPAAYTSGCNIEAHTFAVNRSKFDAAGATIIGVSRDSIQMLNRFSSDPDYCAGEFPVASDPDGAIAQSYGLKSVTPNHTIKNSLGEDVDHALTERTTFVISPESKIVAALSSADDKITPADHVTQSLAIVKELEHEAQ